LKNIEEHTEYIARLSESLRAEELSVVDFDRLRGWLGEMKTELDEAQRLANKEG